MNEHQHAETRGAFCLILIGLLLHAPAVQAGSETPPRWPEMPTVQALLDRELDALQPAKVTREGRGRATPSGQAAAANSLQLLAVYGVDRHLSAQVKVGGDVHTVHAVGDTGTDHPSVSSSTAIVLEAVEGRCVRLRARSALRRVCMPDAAPPAPAVRRVRPTEAQPS